MRRFFLTSLAALLIAPAVLAQDTEVSLVASQDNTIYDPASGAVSNGAGSYLFAGRTNRGDIRRALVEFDMSGVPRGAMVTSATLTLTMSKSIAGSVPVSLHRLLEAWGEGTSDATGEEGTGAPATTGDATWEAAIFPGTAWSTPGGTFAGDASATTTVGANDTYSWSSSLMTSDVQSWADDPSSNHGWIVLGDETSPTTAKRFNSHENGSQSTRPRLTIRYTVTATGVESASLPRDPVLLQNAPNPFRGATRIGFSIPEAAQVYLEVFDLLGRNVKILRSGVLSAGEHEATLDGSNLPPGVYVYRLMVGNRSMTRQMIRLP